MTLSFEFKNVLEASTKDWILLLELQPALKFIHFRVQAKIVKAKHDPVYIIEKIKDTLQASVARSRAFKYPKDEPLS